MVLILRTPTAAVSLLQSKLLQLTDPRLKRKRKHKLIDVLIIAVTALLWGRRTSLIWYSSEKPRSTGCPTS